MSHVEGPTNAGRLTQQEVTRARVAVLSGRGPGASQEEVLSHTRGEIVQAGLPVVRRLAETARDTARARSTASTFVDGGLVTDLEQPGRDPAPAAIPGCKDATTPAVNASSVRDRRRSEAAAIATLVLLALLICRRSRTPMRSATIRSEPDR